MKLSKFRFQGYSHHAWVSCFSSWRSNHPPHPPEKRRLRSYLYHGSSSTLEKLKSINTSPCKETELELSLRFNTASPRTHESRPIPTQPPAVRAAASRCHFPGSAITHGLAFSQLSGVDLMANYPQINISIKYRGSHHHRHERISVIMACAK